jgi:general secretion pathway protein M
MNALLEFWSQRAPRERTALLAAGTVIVLALFWSVLIEPAWSGITRLQRGLPPLRAQAGQLDQLLGEVKSLRDKPPVATVSSTESRSRIEGTLAANGLKATRIVPLSDGDIQITFTNVPYATWVVWLAGAERELGARATSVKATATPTPGNVDLEFALRLSRREGRS